MTKDKRVKGCTNKNCERCYKKFKYKAMENFCSLCGTNLTYVCEKCFSEIEDIDPYHRLCSTCEERKVENKQKVKSAAEQSKKVAIGVATLAPSIVKHMKNVDPKKVGSIVGGMGKVVTEVIKKK